MLLGKTIRCQIGLLANGMVKESIQIMQGSIQKKYI